MMYTTPVITELRKTETHTGSKSCGVNGPTQWDYGFLKRREVKNFKLCARHCVQNKHLILTVILKVFVFVPFPVLQTR